MYTGLMKPLLPTLGAVVLLPFAWPSLGQATETPSYGEIVDDRLNAAQVLLRSVRESNDELTNALQELNVASVTADSAEWKEAKDKVDRGMQGLMKDLQSEIASDKDFLDRLRGSHDGTSTDAVTGNLAALTASAESQRLMATALSALVRLMEAQSEAALGLSNTVRGRLGRWEGTLDRTVETLERAATACRNRAGDYEAILSSFRH